MELSLHTLKTLLTTDFAIDMAINIVGYLIAGTIGVMIYRLFRRGPRTAEESPASASIEAPEQARVARPSTAQAVTNRVQFIRFGERKAPERNNPTPQLTSSDGGVNRRNRTEIFRVARSMIKAGATHDSIRKVLPISEAELSLLSTNNS
jgi:hypothetical protein